MGPTKTATNTNISSGSAERQSTAKRMKGVSTSRLLFLVGLAAIAAALGYTSYFFLTEAEERLAREQFSAIADRALDQSRDIAIRKRNGIVTLASVMERAYPDAEMWPFIKMNGFEVVSNHIITTTSGDSMGLLPIVTPDELTEFETFAKDLYPESGVTRVTGLDENFQRYNETDGETHWGSPYKIFAPFMYHSRGPILFLSNYHSIASRGQDLDIIIACSEERAARLKQDIETSDMSPQPKECSLVTGIDDLAQGRNPVFVPASVLYQPVYPANNQSVLVGFITSTIKWHETLIDVFSSEVNGVDCVVATESQAYTYIVTKGNITLKGTGDLHDRDFSSYGQTIALNGRGLYSDASPNYTLSLYPTQALFDVYATNNPTTSTVGAVCIVFLMALLFFLYDFFVRKEFHHKEALDQARRRFVRFISHEVRTPLNAVCMGLQLHQDEAERLTAMLNTSSHGKTSSKTPLSPLSVTDIEEGEEENDTTDEVEGRVTELSSLGNDILSNATSAVDVLNDLLNYDKVESGTLHLELTVVKIWELIEHTFGEFRQQAHFRNVQYMLDFSAFSSKLNANNMDEESPVADICSAKELPQSVLDCKVVGDGVRISQVLRNLLSNALKFSKDNGKLTVRPSWRRNDNNGNKIREEKITLHSGEAQTFSRWGDLQVEVADTGSGMTKDQLKRLFCEGVQFNVNELQAGQGSGLGLFIAKGILEKHGGSLEAQSQGIGCGTVFTMALPLYHVPDPPEPEPAKHLPSLRSEPVEKVESLMVLVVDDATMNRKLLTRLLNNQGHSCSQAENGLVAMQRVKDMMDNGNRYDAILMDYDMPEMDGPTAAKEIRALGNDSFIVGITGNLFPEDIEHFKACGANLVLPKPLDVHALTDAFVEHGISSPSG